MSLQERTLVIKNFDPEQTTNKLLKELCLQAGPVRNVVVRPDHAFIEYEDVPSVGYSKALLEGTVMFGKKLILEPKLRSQEHYYRYTKLLIDYANHDRYQRAMEQQAQQQQLLLQQPQSQQSQQYQTFNQHPPRQQYQQQYQLPQQQYNHNNARYNDDPRRRSRR